MSDGNGEALTGFKRAWQRLEEIWATRGQGRNAILEKVSAIEADLGIGQATSEYPQVNVKINEVDIDNFPRYFRSR